jgi:hypothetical protein
MLISKTFKYDPEEHPKVHQWFLELDAKGMNASEQIRRLIESEQSKEEIIQKAEDDRKKLQDDVRKLWSEVERLKAGAISRPQPEQVEIIEVEKRVEKIAEQPEIQVNVGALKNRYFKGDD